MFPFFFWLCHAQADGAESRFENGRTNCSPRNYLHKLCSVPRMISSEFVKVQFSPAKFSSVLIWDTHTLTGSMDSKTSDNRRVGDVE